MNQLFRFHVGNVLKNETRSFTHRTLDNVKKANNIRSAKKSLQDFCFTIDFLCADRLKDFDNAGLIIRSVDSLVYFRVFAAA